MNNDYITRPEFNQLESRMNDRFNHLEDKITLTKELLTNEIKTAVIELKNEINEGKVTESRFKKGIAIPSILSVFSIIVSILLAIFF
nr:hypothetical protein [Mammaliicoccus sp. Marseille-Q6498]